MSQIHLHNPINEMPFADVVPVGRMISVPMHTLTLSTWDTHPPIHIPLFCIWPLSCAPSVSVCSGVNPALTAMAPCRPSHIPAG